MRRSAPTRLSFILCLIATATVAVGCLPSQQATEEDAAAQAAVIGTWKYKVSGTAPLDQGVFRITDQDGQLRGIIKDRRIGRLRARVDVDDTRLELTLDGLRISGHIKDDQLTGFLRRQQWDISTRRRQRRGRSRFRSASLSARRVKSATAADAPSTLDCESILREANGCN